MTTLAELSLQLKGGRDLSGEQVAGATAALASAEASEAEKGAFLTALAAKGETAAEVAAFAAEFRARARDPGVARWAGEAIDIVGTGGDHAGGFNVSTLVVFVLAAAGLKVMKHGNRGITSKCGSADLMAGLGVDIEAPPEKLQAALDELGFAFFFAPSYHPAFRLIAPVRKALAASGQRTVFNILGPLINPGRPARILIGAFSDAWVPRLAGALDRLGAEAGIAVHGAIDGNRGIDELTTATVNRVKGIGRLRNLDASWKPEEFGLARAPFSDLLGGDLAANLALAEAVVAGRGPRGLVDTIAWNAAAALWICGRVPEVADGIPRARELLTGGAVREKMEATRRFFSSRR